MANRTQMAVTVELHMVMEVVATMEDTVMSLLMPKTAVSRFFRS
jgi:hypothetical protein